MLFMLSPDRLKRSSMRTQATQTDVKKNQLQSSSGAVTPKFAASPRMQRKKVNFIRKFNEPNFAYGKLILVTLHFPVFRAGWYRKVAKPMD